MNFVHTFAFTNHVNFEAGLQEQQKLNFHQLLSVRKTHANEIRIGSIC